VQTTTTPRAFAEHSQHAICGRGRVMMRPKLNARRGYIWKP